jgi:hypothetical protein
LGRKVCEKILGDENEEVRSEGFVARDRGGNTIFGQSRGGAEFVAAAPAQQGKVKVSVMKESLKQQLDLAGDCCGSPAYQNYET